MSATTTRLTNKDITMLRKAAELLRQEAIAIHEGHTTPGGKWDDDDPQTCRAHAGHDDMLECAEALMEIATRK